MDLDKVVSTMQAINDAKKDAPNDRVRAVEIYVMSDGILFVTVQDVVGMMRTVRCEPNSDINREIESALGVGFGRLNW